jgi:guanylate kinase
MAAKEAYQHIIVNANLDRAVDELAEIILRHRKERR